MESNLISIVSHSSELDSALAVAQLLEQSIQQLGTRKPQGGLLFTGIDFDHPVIVDAIMAQWPDLQLIGCTTDGEFSSVSGYEEDTAVLTLIVSDTCTLTAGWIDNTAADLERACSQSICDAIKGLGAEPSVCILLSDVIRVNGEQILLHLSNATGFRMPIVGGMSADSWRFGETKQFFKETVSPDISVYLLISGSVECSWGMDSGWEPFGEMGTVTRAEGNVIYEINDKPALEFYQEILGEGAMPTLELPVAIHDEQGRFRFMRTSFEFYDKATGAVRFLGNVPEGHRVRITMVDRESILAGAVSAMKMAKENFPAGKTPGLALGFSCSARRVLLGSRTKEEYALVRAVAGEDFSLAGFYTYGEICPNSSGSANEFHNETFVAVLIG